VYGRVGCTHSYKNNDFERVLALKARAHRLEIIGLNQRLPKTQTRR